MGRATAAAFRGGTLYEAGHLRYKASMSLRLFHASEEGKIRRFEPRPAPSPGTGVSGNAVWAVDEAHLPNYLFPRDCPRVSFAASFATTEQDKAKLLGPSTTERVIAVEDAWRGRIEACQLYLYELPVASFELIDPGAGYYISRVAVAPIAVSKPGDLLTELMRRKVELRFLPSLWDLRDSVIASTLEFSVIRFRNAGPRPKK